MPRFQLPCSKILPILDEMPKYKSISVNELSKRAERVATDIETTGTVYRVTRPGRAPMVFVDESSYASLQETVQFLLRHPNWREEFEQSDRDFAAGRYVTLDDYLAERGLDPAEGRPLAVGKRAARRASASRSTKGSARTARARSRAS
jgi:PHD/YefM family antitoxin component YafN of YafNO toxin-antitoxin module